MISIALLLVLNAGDGLLYEPPRPDSFSSYRPTSRARPSGIQVGIASLLAAQVNFEVSGRDDPHALGVFAIGPRVGLLRRTDLDQWMPALSLLAGASLNSAALNPFAELRLEVLNSSPGGLLQPNFLVYLTGGVTQRDALAPHVGLGVGWNFWPRNLSFGGSGAATALLLMFIAGRVEARYVARPFLGPGNDYVAMMFGAGT